MRYEILDGPNGNVIGGVMADEAWMAEHYSHYREAPVPEPERAEDWHISRGAFFDRFGAQKWPILASTDPLVQAVITDCTVRQYIDLRGRAADIGAALDLLISKGFAIDKAAILNTKPTGSEVFRP